MGPNQSIEITFEEAPTIDWTKTSPEDLKQLSKIKILLRLSSDKLIFFLLGTIWRTSWRRDATRISCTFAQFRGEQDRKTKTPAADSIAAGVTQYGAP